MDRDRKQERRGKAVMFIRMIDFLIPCRRSSFQTKRLASKAARYRPTNTILSWVMNEATSLHTSADVKKEPMPPCKRDSRLPDRPEIRELLQANVVTLPPAHIRPKTYFLGWSTESLYCHEHRARKVPTCLYKKRTDRPARTQCLHDICY